MTTPISFSNLNLSQELMRALEAMDFTSPTPIQSETLPLLLEGDTDFLGLAATGTGKTAAFSIPLLERLDASRREVQALVLCPTRELAIQVAGQIDLLGKYKGVRSLPIYGGTGYGEQLAGLRAGVQIVVGTPGRVVDHIEKGTLRLESLRTLVLDEADEMISMGFQEDLEAVLKAATVNESRRPSIWLFSATMGHDVKHVADSYLTDPKKVQVNRTEMLPDTVEQVFYKIHEYDKPDLLSKVIDIADDFYGIVFCQTKALVTDVHAFLLSKGYKADALHGDLDQKQRDRVMASFRDRKISVLVATDVACRGLDVKDVTHVVNYSLPRELDNYVHRIGRTARSGKTGTAISFVTFSHRDLVGKIERMTKKRMTEAQPPTMKDIAQKRVEKTHASFTSQGAQGRATAMVSEEWKTELESLSREEIVGRFLNLMMPEAFVKEEKVYGKRLPDGRDRPAQQRLDRRGASREDNRGEERSGGAGKPFRKFQNSKFQDRKFQDRPSFKGGKKPWKKAEREESSFEREPEWHSGKHSEERPQKRSRKSSEGNFERPQAAPGSRWKNNFKAKPFGGRPAFEQAPDKPLKKKKYKKLFGKWKERAERSKHSASSN